MVLLCLPFVLWGAVAVAPAAAANPVFCGQVITSPGVYTLTADLVCTGPIAPPQDPNVPVWPGGAALTVFDADATINLNGHSIIGPGSTSNRLGVWVVGNFTSPHVLIQSGTVRGFGTGVQLENGSASTSSLRVTHNGVGIRSTFPPRTVSGFVNVDSSYINENDADGIDVCCGNSLGVTNSQINGNRGTGISAPFSPLGVTGSTIARNQGGGVYQSEFAAGFLNTIVINNDVLIDFNDFPFSTYSFIGNTFNGSVMTYAADPFFGPVHTKVVERNITLNGGQCIGIFCKAG
jgi:hypothetical protein